MSNIRRKRKKKHHISLIILAIIIPLIIGGFSYYLYYDYSHRVNVSCIKELGSEITANDLAMAGDIKCEFVSTGDMDTNQSGIYDVVVKSGFFTYDCQIIITDTTPPTAKVSKQDIIIGNSISPIDFFTDIEDASEVHAEFTNEPDFSKLGEQQINLILADNSYNSTTFETTLTIHDIDNEPPVFNGVHDFTIYTNENISYKKRFSATDAIDGDIDFTVEGVVNNDQVGEYPITLTATDWAGNSTSVDIVVSVIKSEHTQEEIDTLADEVLADIVTPDMSKLEIVKAIYNYMECNMGFNDYAEKGDWIKSAYDGLTLHNGDCYTYACVSKALLTRAGIKNMDIEIIPTATRHHYWNLVDIGEGWHHFDTTPRKEHPNLCYLTDEELMEYSNAHYHSHNYDKNIYTDIK